MSPSPATSARRQALLRLLAETQARHPQRALPWREFMRLALYHPQWGYYAAHVPGVGRSGDFTTAPALTTSLAKAVLDWAQKMRQRFPALRQAPLLEIGAGEGHLAAACLARRPWRELLQPYGIVEISPPLREKQKTRLRWRPVRWFDSMTTALRWSKGRALIFSNELVDAFPCSVWERQATGWHEWGLRWEDGRMVEVTWAGAPPDSTVFAPEVARDFAVGQRVETHETWRAWLAEWTPEVRAAAMLTVDYGGPVEGLYHRRPRGTLRAYWQHQRYTGTDLWARFGRQDLTADVNFSDLQKWGEAEGWQHEKPLPLADFLQTAGRHPAGRLSATEARLRDPTEAGGAFWVLSQWCLAENRARPD